VHVNLVDQYDAFVVCGRKPVFVREFKFPVEVVESAHDVEHKGGNSAITVAKLLQGEIAIAELNRQARRADARDAHTLRQKSIGEKSKDLAEHIGCPASARRFRVLFERLQQHLLQPAYAFNERSVLPKETDEGRHSSRSDHEALCLGAS